MAATTSLPTEHQHTDKPALRDFRQEVTDSIVGMLERGVAPWQKPWEPGASSLGIPFNPTSERAYRGGNAIHLMAKGLERGYEDPRWMTYKQASDNGWRVRRGEKGTQIEYWETKHAPDRTQPARPDGGGDGSTANGNNADAEKSRFIHRVYTVFNAQQIEGIPPHTPEQHTTFEAEQAGEQILKNSGANIAHDQADRAFYSRSQDSIHLPPKDAFKDAAGYYGTALHELAHWTGHPSRLDRSTLTDSYRFGDVNYAKEELRAELASVFLAAQRGIPHNPEQHAAYVNSWIGALKRDKNEIFRAAHDASKATDFILALERDKSIGEEDLVSGPVLTSRASGASPAAMLEQETEEIHHDRERVDEKESDAGLSAADPAILESADNANEHAAPVRESTQYTARYEPGSGTVNVHAKQTATDRRSTIDAPNGDSIMEAKSITAKVLGDSAKTLTAQTENGSYRGPGDFDEFDVFSKCQIVWLHGKAEQYSDKNVAGEISVLDEKLLQLIRPLLRASPIIVMGYRGAEPSVMEGLFGQSDAGRLDFRNGVYWCVRPNQPMHSRVQALAERLRSNFTLLEIDGFDEALQKVSKGLIGKDRFSGSQARSAAPAHRSFDEQIVAGVSTDDLDLDLALSTLTVYCEKLGRTPLTREALLPLMREQGLLVRTEAGLDEVTKGAILLFGRATQSIIPQAVVSVTEAGKRREIYDGNLITQHRRLLEKLESEDVNPVLTLKKRRSHDDQLAYPPRVLVELLVNLLVHRDYAVEQSANIDVSPGDHITFTNPGELTPAMKKLLVVEENGRIVVSNQATDLRNVSLCDIFFGIKAMERAGTGLVDVTKLMTESSGSSEFFSDPAEHTFTAIVRQAASSAGSRVVAHSGRPTGIYILNVLPFSALPGKLSVVRLKMRLRHRPNTVVLDDCGIFVERSSEEKVELWSFAPLPVLLNYLAPIADVERSKPLDRQDVEQDADERRVLSWLLRKHFEAYIRDFEDDGLRLEGSKSHRAFFVGDEGKNRFVVWDSPQKRGNRREVVKCRNDERPWFENEGFGYDIVYLSGKWGVRIKPFYMFTGQDAQKPLPAFTRTAKATRRMKWDKNKNVETDLAFWSVFIGRGGATLNLGDIHTDDLLVDTAFLTLEVAESK